MKKLAVVLVVLCACGKSDKSKANDKPIDPPSLGNGVTVPPGHETTFTFDGKPVKLEYTWLEVLSYEGKSAIRIFARGGHHGTFTMAAPIPEGTSKPDQLAGSTFGAFSNGVTFGNTPIMATGTGAEIKITEVTPDHISGTFESQACEFGKRTCDRPMNVTSGTFNAFRSALSDDAAFARYMK